jgi:hypothetical protein
VIVSFSSQPTRKLRRRGPALLAQPHTVGRAEVGVIAILDEGFERPLREAAALSELSVPSSRSRRQPSPMEAG